MRCKSMREFTTEARRHGEEERGRFSSQPWRLGITHSQLKCQSITPCRFSELIILGRISVSPCLRGESPLADHVNLRGQEICHDM